MESEGVREEGWRVKGCMRRGARGGMESEGVREEGWRVKHSSRSSCKLFFP